MLAVTQEEDLLLILIVKEKIALPFQFVYKCRKETNW